ncbi:NAD-dependent epimerase/dehydratase family protein [Streptantibioticus ferralitis]|uniref:NAD-dependent epimerase/dehydratase family protein n=1 Tax=Streptantibioticus ferralitis TaxID=236510 RepID=A0ABT5Z5T0_9ACTN|nr:NAD-dependent epimerase/dehydratase family protein [Streptantibioticus ferralitis]MDF2258901.1 NAD-dependent epimerase/dehydratase family protein [Streptantibioticus ferralitis]
MKLLVIGGSVFVGRAFAAEGLRRGWEVTVFNRGRTQADPPGVRALRGDRTDEADLATLAAAGPYDAVVDVCGYVPREVAKSAAALAEHADAYLFVSTINVYPGYPALPTDESSPRQGGTADAGPKDGDYGWLKDGCEKAVRQAFPGRVVVLQPGLIVGPHDRARRTTAWLRRAARGGPMAVPGAPDRPLRVIDVRDLAAFGLDLLTSAPKDEVEDYLVPGAPDNGSWGDYLDACVAATAGRAELVYIDDQLFVDHEVEPWTEIPLWLQPGPQSAAVWTASCAKALAAGLRCRPVADSIRDTAAWLFAPGGEQEAFEDYKHFGGWTPFLSAETEQAILAAHATEQPQTE